MKLQQATKLVIITESFIAGRVCRVIEMCGATGYTVVAAGGKGSHNLHATSDRASVIQEFTNVKIEVILIDRAAAESIIQRVADDCFHDYSGIMYLEDVEVLRSEKFLKAGASGGH